jgi:hypothetical protein
MISKHEEALSSIPNTAPKEKKGDIAQSFRAESPRSGSPLVMWPGGEGLRTSLQMYM